MKHLSLAISHPSAIVTYGLMKLASQLREYALSVYDGNSDNLIKLVEERDPSIVVTDPLVVEIDSLRQLRSWPKRPVIVALAVSPLPPQTMAEFDYVINIYDASQRLEEIIKSTLALSEKAEEQLVALSPREKDVVIGIVKGLSNKEIAAELCVSVNTIMTHRRNIAAKLQIHSAAGLTIYAIINKLVKIEDLKM